MHRHRDQIFRSGTYCVTRVNDGRYAVSVWTTKNTK
jgi:hypothetical protein